VFLERNLRGPVVLLASLRSDELHRRHPLRPVLAELIRRDGWSRAALLDFQRLRLAQALRHAAAASPYYRQAIGTAIADGASLADLPVLTKRELMDNWDRIVTDPRLRLHDVERHDRSRPARRPGRAP